MVEVVRGTPTSTRTSSPASATPASTPPASSSTAPVVGIGEAAYRAVTLSRAASRSSRRCGAASRSSRTGWSARAWPAAASACWRWRSRSRPRARGYPDTTEAIVAAGRRRSTSSAPRPWCWPAAAWRTSPRAVERGVGVPVCDGVAVGVLLAHGLWRAGLATSKRGALAWPEPIPLPRHAGAARCWRPPSARTAARRSCAGRRCRIPMPAPDEVVVAVHACGLNHSDLDSRAGTSRWPFTFPWVLGAEFAGVVDEVGSAVEGVARRRPGHGLPAVRVRRAALPARAGGPTCARASRSTAPTAGAATRSGCGCRRGR